MRTSIALSVLALAVTLSTGAVAGKYDPRATMSGVGPIRIGMNERQLEDAIGQRLPETQDASEDSCRQVEAGPRWPGTSVMLLDGRVARIDVTKRGIPTLSGALVGDLALATAPPPPPKPSPSPSEGTRRSATTTKAQSTAPTPAPTQSKP